MKLMAMQIRFRGVVKTFTVFLMVLAGIAFSYQPADASLVEIVASGEVGDVVVDEDPATTTPFDTLLSGDPWSFRFVYESDTPLSDSNEAGQFSYLSAVTFAQITLAGTIYNVFDANYVYTFDTDRENRDALGLAVGGDGYRFYLDLRDHEADQIDPSGTLLASIDLAEFEDYLFYGTWLVPDGAGGADMAAYFTTVVSDITSQPISNVPIPGTLVLFSSGIVGLIAVRRGRKA